MRYNNFVFITQSQYFIFIPVHPSARSILLCVQPIRDGEHVDVSAGMATVLQWTRIQLHTAGGRRHAQRWSLWCSSVIDSFVMFIATK